MKITLSPIDRMICGFVGLSRSFTAAKDSRQLEPGRSDLGIERHIVGVFAEFAVARHLGINFNPVTDRPDTMIGDVGGFQVKSITNPKHSLIVQKDERLEFTYILCLVSITSVDLLGFMRGRAAKRDEFWKEIDEARGIHQAAYFIRQNRLSPIAEL